MECGLPEDTQASGEVFDPTRDKPFLDMVSELRQVRVSEEEFIDVAKNRIRVEILARLLLLARLAHDNADVTPTQFLLSQLNGGQTFIAKAVHHLRGYLDTDTQAVMHELNDALKPLLDRNEGAIRQQHQPLSPPSSRPATPAKPRLLFALDEANTGYTKVLYGRFHSLSANQPRGVASPIIQVVSQLNLQVPFSLIVSGTSMSMRRGDSVQSDIGKSRGSLFKVFGMAHNTSPSWCLSQLINLDGCPLDAEDAESLIGRHRLVARVVEGLPALVASSNGAAKQAILKSAVKASVHAHAERLTARLRAVLREGPNVVQDTVKKNAKLLDKMVVASALFQGRVRFPPGEQDTDTDFVELGLCGTKEEFQGALSWTLAEPFAKTCVQDVLKDECADSLLKALTLHATKDLENVIAALGKKTTARGLLVEPLEFIPFLGKDYQDKAVSQIPLLQGIKKLHPDLNFPAWCNTVQFKATRYGNADSLGIKDECKFLASEVAIGTIFSPSNVLRPDGVLMLSQPPGHCAVTFGSALYTTKVSKAKEESQERSTQLALGYFLADGSSVNKRHKQDRESFEASKLHEPAGCLRIHFLLPRAAEDVNLCQVAHIPSAGSKRKHTASAEDVVVNITSAHMPLLFPVEQHEPLLRLLAYATSTTPAEWGLQ